MLKRATFALLFSFYFQLNYVLLEKHVETRRHGWKIVLNLGSDKIQLQWSWL